MASIQDDWVEIQTRLPIYPRHEARTPVTTPRLLIRTFDPTDLAALHRLRTQPEVMRWTTAGVPDADIEVTRERLVAHIPPLGINTYHFAICLAETGEMIGAGGNHQRVGELGFPVIGYMLCKEVWGQGYGTEFVGAFTKMWWGLERERCTLRVDRDLVIEGKGTGHDVDAEEKEEVLVAIIEEENVASRKVLERCGYVLLKRWEAEGNKEGEMDKLLVYGSFRPGASTSPKGESC